MKHFNEHSPEVLRKIQELYHKAVDGSISAALLEAMRYGYVLRQQDERPLPERIPDL